MHGLLALATCICCRLLPLVSSLVWSMSSQALLQVRTLGMQFCSSHMLPYPPHPTPHPLPHGPRLLLCSTLAELAPRFYAQAKPHIEAAQRYWQQQVALTAAAADGEAPLPADTPQ